MKKLSILFLAIVASISTIFARSFQIGDLYYNLDFNNNTAEVTYKSCDYTYGYKYNDGWSITTANIPFSITYNGTKFSVTSIGDYAFCGCTALTSVTIPNSVTSIGEAAFSDCTSLTSVTIPNSVTSIGYYAFYNCSGLTSVTIPNSVTSIGTSAFHNCTGLTSVTIPNSVTSIGDWAFFNVPNIVYSGTATGSPWNARSVNGYVDGYLVYSDASKTSLLACSAAAKGDIVIPSSVTSIGDYAFYGCTGLTSVTIPNSVTSIGEAAFSDCTSLTSVTIPNSVTSIGCGAFFDCSSLTSIICYAVTPPEYDAHPTDRTDTSVPIYVPAGSVDAYKNADWWKWFTYILPIVGTSTESAEVKATPSSSNSVSVTWPEVAGATTYTIEIKKNGVLICTLVFNAAGQLQSLTFAAPARDGARNVASALQAGNGWTYTVAGLESNTEYTYTVIAKNANGGVLLNQTVGFKTPLPDGIEDVVSDSGAAVKTLYNGQVLIQRSGKTYTIQGQEVK